MTNDYILRQVIKETPKAYMVAVEVANRRDGWHTKFEWVSKSVCKVDEAGNVYVPMWIIGNGVW